jgi:hypothetical protein
MTELERQGVIALGEMIGVAAEFECGIEVHIPL